MNIFDVKPVRDLKLKKNLYRMTAKSIELWNAYRKCATSFSVFLFPHFLVQNLGYKNISGMINRVLTLKMCIVIPGFSSHRKSMDYSWIIICGL